MAWLVATVDRGAHFATDDEVATWPDVVLAATRRLPRGAASVPGVAAGSRAREAGLPQQQR